MSIIDRECHDHNGTLLWRTINMVFVIVSCYLTCCWYISNHDTGQHLSQDKLLEGKGQLPSPSNSIAKCRSCRIYERVCQNAIYFCFAVACLPAKYCTVSAFGGTDYHDAYRDKLIEPCTGSSHRQLQ